MSKTGGYPPGCTQRHVDEAAPGYWDAPQEEGPEKECVLCGKEIAAEDMPAEKFWGEPCHSVCKEDYIQNEEGPEYEPE